MGHQVNEKEVIMIRTTEKLLEDAELIEEWFNSVSLEDIGRYNAIENHRMLKIKQLFKELSAKVRELKGDDLPSVMKKIQEDMQKRSDKINEGK